ncbi:hypothetical protein DBP19_36260 [Streptomyces sp. CS090A]|uniref:hypothetical protein n=1 Tax=Streptomyces sp. CS090A TaxID=2162710 RepID=UPI000D51ADAF|nr:hypothetical protein [Streptomyces sp. CS090A]PVC80594.1 hypothetical protein DBP19_36260 [Streptomyces sp. CS090A]
MTTVTGKLIGGIPKQTRLEIELVDVTGTRAIGYAGGEEAEVVRPVPVKPQEDGTWSADLIPNAQIQADAGDTVWAVMEGRAYDGTPVMTYIVVPETGGPHWVGDLRVDLGDAPTGGSTVVYVPGPEGPAGPAGNTGPQGIPGANGANGSDGAPGADGAIGPTGPQGPQGEPGPQGPAGVNGATGPAGPKGDTGATGSTGAPGAAGETGPAGPKGDTGATGAAGATGAQGPQGPAGVPPTGDVVGVTRTVDKPADESVTSSTALQDDDHLTLSVTGGGRYAIDACLVASGDPAGDLLLTIAAPSGSTGHWAPGGITLGVSDGTGSLRLTRYDPGTAIGVGITAAGLIVTPVGTITAGTSGAITVQWAQNTANATATVLRAGSWLRLTRVA